MTADNLSALQLATFKQSLEGRAGDVEQCSSDKGNWQAQLALKLAYHQATHSAKGKTCLSRCRHHGPLYVQKPFYPEGDDLAHLYLLHPPGGIVSGDHLHISVDVEEGAKSLITTPGAARIYRARDDRALQQQTVNITIAENASLEWFPLETIVYNDADVCLSNRIELEDNARFIGWEITCFGLPASEQWFKQGSFEQQYQIFYQGRPLFIDRLCINDSNREQLLQAQVAMQAKTVSGFFILSRLEKDESLMEKLRACIALLAMQQRVAITHVGDCLIARYLGDSAEQARKVFTEIWRIARPLLLKREACAPRIWLT